MNDDNDATVGVFSNENLLPVPAVLATLLVLFFGTDYVANGGIESDGYVDLLILPVIAALAAFLGMVLNTFGESASATKSRNSLISILIIFISYILIEFSILEPLEGFTFAFMAVSSLLLFISGRNEELTILLSVVIGFHLAISTATRYSLDETSWAGNPDELIDVVRSSIGSIFFASWAASISLGVLLTLAMRGRFATPGTGSWFSDLPSIMPNAGIITATAVFVVNLIPVIWLSTFDDVTSYDNHLYLGSVWAIFATIVVIFVSFCNSERWHVLGTVVALNWVMYTLAHLQEIGNDLPLSQLNGDGNISLFTWFLLVFWLNVGGMMIAASGRFGDISPRRDNSEFRKWWNQHSYGVMVSLALFVALAVRVGWNVLPAMNAAGTGLWDMSGGSDPWYMKRVVDYIVLERSHLIVDADRAYPMVAINPRPPLFSWSLALGGILLSWLSGMSIETSVWWSVAALPAIFGALIVLPIAALARKLHSNMAGIIAAWLIALMPGHISHSTFGLADHDAFAMLFLAIAFYYWVKAMNNLTNQRLFNTPSLSPLYIVAGIRKMWSEHTKVMANATLAGVSFAIVALGWKGFVYGPGILFIAFAFQVFFNMFRRRDSLPITAASLQMMLTAFVIPLPFYCRPELGLLFDPSGFQPMFYIIGFTLALGWISSSYRDRPWLLVLGSTVVLMGSILAVLYSLQRFNVYDGWDVLFTGGFYFSKNKIFGTIGEAQAPSRGVLFASYGPIVSLIAIFVSVILLWRGARKEKQSHILLGLWVLIAIYMAWSAGRFIFNATPAISVVGGIGIAMMWNYANFSGFSKEWRKSGIATPRTRFWANWSASKRHPGVPVILLVLMLVCTQHITYGIDSGIPRGEQSASDVDQTIHDITPDVFRQEVLGFSLLNSENYDANGDLWYMGTFGPGFNSGSWNMAYEWLSEQDTEVSFSERPAFVSWWDYGFQALAQGQHPTVADNFQSGIPNSGAMLLSASQDDTLSLFITTLAQGDRRSTDSSGFTDEFETLLLDGHMTQAQYDEFSIIMSLNKGDSNVVLSRSLSVVAVDGQYELLRGYQLESNGIPSSDELWIVLEDGEIISEVSTNEESAIDEFNDARNSVSDLDRYPKGHDMEGELIIQFYDIAGYRYTPDLIEDFEDVSTALHRVNAKLALSRAFLLQMFDSSGINDLYHDISTNLVYDVQNYEGPLGEMISRNNEIRYFAVDNRLYPLGGQYYEDYSYHQGQTTGIFHAPTSLSGLETETYISSLYQTQRGDGPIIPRTSAEYEIEYMNDVIRQQSGALTDVNEMIRMIDIDYQHQPEFFDTMVARIYVGYGTSTLGLPGDAEQPAPHFYTSGAPGSYLENAYPLPGAMMNHMVLSNWYQPDCETDEDGNLTDSDCTNLGIGSANTQVKIMKYYSGATIEGTVELDGVGPVPNAKILIERDAFSGDEVEIDGQVTDRDQRTYWIPIGTTDADENGEYSFIAPAGKIRVSAFYGESDLDSARTQIMTTNVGQSLGDIFESETADVRILNPITGILGNVSGSTWLSETIVNISGVDGHSNGESVISAPIIVEPASSIGRLVWAGTEAFSGDSLDDATVELTPSWDMIDAEPYVLSTSDGTIDGEDLRFEGTGEVTFTGEGSVITQTTATISDFTGNYTQTVFNNHSITGDGEFAGNGIIDGVINDDISELVNCDVNETMPENSSLCMQSDGKYLLNGIVNATGRFTANGVASFTQKLVQSTFIGSGVFSTDTSNSELTSYGTINGTGSFTGTGIFSGVMVQPGTFHIVDAIPGSYDVAVIFSDGTHVAIDDVYTISQSSNGPITEIDIHGGSIAAELVDQTGNPIMASIILRTNESNASDAIYDCDDVQYAPCLISPELTWDDTELIGSKVTFGPIMPGEYIAELDIDGDGFSELYVEYIFDANTASSFVFPSPVPNTSDLTFQLLRDGDDGNSEFVNDLDLILNQKNGSGTPVTPVFNNMTNEYYVELTPGTWILNYTLSETEQLWEEIEVGDNDFSSVYEFYTSQVVTGTLYYNENIDENLVDENKTLEFVPIVFYWDDFSTTVETSSNGTFSLVLPQGTLVDAVTQLGTNLKLVNGTQFTVNSDMEDIVMVARPGQSITGIISINRADNYYNSDVGGWESATVVAESLDYDVKWRAQTNDGGTFEMVLPKGNWEFSVISEDFTSGTNTTNVDNNNDTVEIIIYPVDSILSVDFFLDNSGDNNISNGTPVNYDFTLISLINGLDYQIDIDNSSWDGTGHADVSVEPGIYRISVEISDVNQGDLFGTRIMTGDVDFQVGMDSSTIQRSIGFDPEWRVSMTFTNESGGPLSEQLVRLTNVENGWILSRTTDINGSVVDFIAQGDWIVTTETVNDGVKEGLRTLITSSSDITSEELQMSTTQLSEVSFTLTEDDSGSALSGISLSLESADGLGAFSIEATNSTGFASNDLVTGNWVVSLNYTEDGKRWIVDDYSLAVVPGSDNHYNLTANLFVALTGNVFWDLNDNNASNIGEGISEVNMEFSNDLLPLIPIDSDDNGDWELFVPANTIWSINTSYDGFENVQESVSVSNVSNEVLLELTAGLVDVSGNISYDLGISSIPLEDIIVSIIPTAGLVREAVEPVLNSSDGVWSGEWSAQLEPGLWIVSASVPNQDLVIMGLLDVDVVDGGTLEMELTRGGLLDVTTEWLDYDGISRNIGEINDSNVVIDIGFGMKWIQVVDETGTLSLLLPNGNVQFSGDFDVEQRGISMEYMAGLGVDIYSGQESPILNLLYNRISNHDISIQTLNLTSGDDSYVGSMSDVNLVENETDGFVPVEFTLEVEYLGHESYDLYTVGGAISGSDGSDWTLEFNNGSGDWNTSTQFEVGLDNSLMFNDLNIRVTPANQSVAHSFDDGHMVTIIVSTQDGYQETHELIVRVPQIHGFVSNPMEEVYGVAPGELIIIPIEFTNSGNGDDKFEFGFDDSELPDGWSRTGPTSHTLGGFVSTTHSVTVVAPDVDNDEQFTIYVTPTDKAGNTYENIEINIMSSHPILKVENVQSLGGGEPVAGGQITYVATVSNDGLVDAEQVELVATLCNDVACNNPTSVSALTILDVSAQSETLFSFLFDLSDITTAPYYLVLEINSSVFGEENVDDSNWNEVDGIMIGSKNVDVRSPAVSDDESTDWIPYLLIAGLVIIVLYLTKSKSRRPGAPF